NGMTIPDYSIASDMQMVFVDPITGQYLNNGSNSGHIGYLVFIDSVTGQHLEQTANGGKASYSVEVYPGTYDVYFESFPAYDDLGAPLGLWKVTSGLALGSDTTLDVLPRAVTVSGHLDGMAPAGSLVWID